MGECVSESVCVCVCVCVCVSESLSQYGSTFESVLSIPIWAGIALSVQQLATGWVVRGLNPGSDEIFRTHPD